ncbi:MAG: hypothetical protein U0169_13315 [Polyangiaceae bacterium]
MRLRLPASVACVVAIAAASIPTSVPRVALADVGCRRVSGPLLDRTERAIRAAYRKTQPPSRVFVDFACDPQDDAFREIHFDEGSGHGGTLRSFRLVREGVVFSVRRYGYAGYPLRGPRADGNEHAFAFDEASIPVEKIDALVPAMRLAAHASVHEVALETDVGFGMSGTISSNDYHLALTTKDDHGRVFQRAFTGYDGTTEQDGSIPMNLAVKPLRDLLDAATYRSTALRPADTTWLAEHVAAEVASKGSRWVRDRSVAMAEAAGVTLPAGTVTKAP